MTGLPDPTVTVWRNCIPHECSLMYWGRKWKFRHDKKYKRLIHLRRFHIWTVHAPVDGGERLVTDTTKTPGRHEFHCFHADGKPMELGDEVDV